MSNEESFPRVLYGDERIADEMTDKGYLSRVSVEFEDGRQYPIHVTDQQTLNDDIARDFQRGEPVSFEIALVVVPAVTRDCVDAAVKALDRRGYFNSLRPIKSWSVSGPVYADGDGD